MNSALRLTLRVACLTTVFVAAVPPDAELRAASMAQCAVCTHLPTCPVFIETYDAACRTQCGSGSYAGACTGYLEEDALGCFEPGNMSIVCYEPE
jgi:hypothetical protein